MGTATFSGQIPSVMVIDDDEFSCEVLKEMLVEQGITDIHIAYNGREALIALDHLARPPDLVICDLFMPDMDGIEFMAELTKQHYQGGLVLMSGVNVEMLTVAQTLARANGLKLRGSYQKPLQYNTLASVLGMDPDWQPVPAGPVGVAAELVA